MSARRSDIVAEIDRQRFQLVVSLLRVYNYYRVLVGFTLLGIFYQSFFTTRLGELAPQAFYWFTVLYAAVNIASVAFAETIAHRFFHRPPVILLIVVLDVLALTAMMYLSGGVSSGLGVLNVIVVAAGAILVSGRTSTAIAAIATIAVLYEEFYLSLGAVAGGANLFQAGILGVLYFATSVALQYLSRRLRSAEITALTRAAEIADLERVNRRIIQRMRTGIIIAGPRNAIRMANQSARSLLGLANRTDGLTVLPEALGDRLSHWRSDVTTRNAPFQITPTTPEVQINFSAVRADQPDGDVIIFLEDTTNVQHRAQQLKLAALGRLSAGIAHEIRNPLGAISHAAQLLSESPNLAKGDARLTDIIHSHVKRMNGVIENVLEMSRRRPPNPAKIQLGPWLDEFVAEFKAAANADADIRLMVEPEDTQVRIDKSQMSQVITNLAQNGIRYSLQACGKPKLSLVGGVDAATDRPYLNIIDRGTGVPEDEVANLFEPFYTTEATGTGLGLYISRELCEANQARLSYTQDPDGGSCFRITFAHPDRITG